VPGRGIYLYYVIKLGGYWKQGRVRIEWALFFDKNLRRAWQILAEKERGWGLRVKAIPLSFMRAQPGAAVLHFGDRCLIILVQGQLPCMGAGQDDLRKN
jgi:hypothetical protein